MSEKIFAPFTPEQVEALKLWQSSGSFHPFTCCSYDGCKRMKQPNEGELIPTEEGWVCPCGKWKQEWCHTFMIDPIKRDVDFVVGIKLKFRTEISLEENYDSAINGDESEI